MFERCVGAFCHFEILSYESKLVLSSVVLRFDLFELRVEGVGQLDLLANQASFLATGLVEHRDYVLFHYLRRQLRSYHAERYFRILAG